MMRLKLTRVSAFRIHCRLCRMLDTDAAYHTRNSDVGERQGSFFSQSVNKTRCPLELTIFGLDTIHRNQKE